MVKKETKILAIDCSFGGYSVAIASSSRGTLVDYYHPRIFPTKGIISTIDKSLKSAGTELSAINVVAFAAGPGLFSGIRSACMVAQGISYVHNLPVVAVKTTHALAVACTQSKALVAYPAYQGHCYLATVEKKNKLWHHTFGPMLSSYSDMPTISGNWELCGHRLYVLEHYCRSAVVGKLERLPSINKSLAPTVAKLGLQLAAKGKATDPFNARPYYVRMKVAYTKKEQQELKNSE